MLPFGINCRLQLAGLGKKREESVKPTCFIHLSMSSPNGGGGCSDNPREFGCDVYPQGEDFDGTSCI